jgi:chloramphenicol 3-O-phosphotransferase
MSITALQQTPSLVLITGIMASGKSSVAQRLAERLPRSVHLRGDLFRRMIVRGQAAMELTLSAEAEAQLWLRYRLAIGAAKQYIAAGFTLVYQDIVLGAAFPHVLAELDGAPCYCVVLCPNVAAIEAREAGRAKSGYSPDFTVAAFDRVLRTETPRLGLWLDSSELTVDETVDAILANLTQARIG